jgi:hypothetical protein
LNREAGRQDRENPRKPNSCPQTYATRLVHRYLPLPVERQSSFKQFSITYSPQASRKRDTFATLGHNFVDKRTRVDRSHLRAAPMMVDNRQSDWQPGIFTRLNKRSRSTNKHADKVAIRAAIANKKARPLAGLFLDACRVVCAAELALS